MAVNPISTPEQPENGALLALRLLDGGQVWRYPTAAPILTTPALSPDGSLVLGGDEFGQAFALQAQTGVQRWRVALQGQSLGERAPVAAGDLVYYRSQPTYFFHRLLHEGDNGLDASGPLLPGDAADWARARTGVLAYLNANPTRQTFFALRTADGSSAGTAPILYTYGNNDIPASPVVAPTGEIYVVYCPRRGIQNNGGSVHVSSKYDAEMGRLNPAGLDVAPLSAVDPLSGVPQFRLTSDEPAALTLGGGVLWVDNWERLGGLDLRNGRLLHVGNVSNDWPECSAANGREGTSAPQRIDFGPAGPNPYFPLSGSGPAFPFPSPRVGEGHARGGVVIANGMLYWRVIESGLAGISHLTGGATCPPPLVWTDAAASAPTAAAAPTPPVAPTDPRPLAEYLTLDRATPNPNPDLGLKSQLNR